jgi:hypothetical protein
MIRRNRCSVLFVVSIKSGRGCNNAVISAIFHPIFRTFGQLRKGINDEAV